MKWNDHKPAVGRKTEKKVPIIQFTDKESHEPDKILKFLLICYIFLMTQSIILTEFRLST